jgi:two-component system, NtrC family, sensor kinase
MARSGRIKTLLVLSLAPVLLYLGLLNVVDRAQWKTTADGIHWSQGDTGLRVAAVESDVLRVVLREGDLLVDINGLRIRSLDDYTEVVEVLTNRATVPSVADYTFHRDGSGEWTVPVTISVQSQLGGADLPLLVVACAFLLIGVVTYLRNGRAVGAFHFALVCMVAFVLLLFRYSGRADAFDLAVYWITAVAFLLLPPLFLHFCLNFPEPHRWLSGRSHRALLLYVPALFLGLIHLSWFAGELRVLGLARTPAGAALLDKVELAHFVLYFAFAAATLLRTRRAAPGLVHQKQMQWITAGTILGILPFGLLYVAPYLLDWTIARWMEASVVSLVLIPLSFGYAIAHFRLKDVDLIFKRGVAYVVASSALLAFYVAIALLIAHAVHDFSPQSGFFLLAVSALVVAIFFAPLRDRIQEQLDRYFYKDRYGYRRSFVDFGRTLGSEIQLSRLTERICDRIQKALDVSPIAILVRDEHRGNVFRLETGAGLETLDLPPAMEISREVLGELAGREGRLGGDGGGGLNDVRERVYQWGVRHVEPLTVRGRVIGFLGLGRRRNGDYLTSEDLDLLSSLAGYAAIAIDNAMLYRSLEAKAGELHQLQVYAENVIESISLGVVVITAEGRVTVWNSTMTSLTGLPREDAVDRLLSDVLPRNLVESVLEMVDGPDWIVRRLSRLFRAHIRLDDGTARLINVTLSPFISRDSVNTGTLLVFDDITEKVQLESQLQQAEKLSSIGLFAAGLAHEVNTPLAAISSYAQMLLGETPRDDPRHELLRKVETQSFRASDILNNLLNFARFSDRDFEEVNVNSLMLDTLSLLDHQFRNGDIKVDVDFDPTLPRTVGNGGKLQQVFMNLFLNARDSMPKGGRLRLSTRCEDSELIVKVADTGSGISREDIRRIYDPFFTTKSVGKGTGLGLSVSYGIIQEHSGRIAVDSEPGKGTTFSLHLPVKRVH